MVACERIKLSPIVCPKLRKNLRFGAPMSPHIVGSDPPDWPQSGQIRGANALIEPMRRGSYLRFWTPRDPRYRGLIPCRARVLVQRPGCVFLATPPFSLPRPRCRPFLTGLTSMAQVDSLVLFSVLARRTQRDRRQRRSSSVFPLWSVFTAISQSKPCNVGPILQLGNLEAQRVAR